MKESTMVKINREHDESQKTSSLCSAVERLVMPGVFEVELKVVKGYCNQSDIKKMKQSFKLADDACDCCAKGIVLGQLYDHPDNNGLYLFRGKFVISEVAEKIVELSREA